MCILDDIKTELKNVATYVTGSGKIVARDSCHLQDIIRRRIHKYGPNCDLNDIDVRHVKDMGWLFEHMNFTGDISKWDVSNVSNMDYMFSDSTFNGDISKWDVSNVEDYGDIFYDCAIEEKYKPKKFK